MWRTLQVFSIIMAIMYSCSTLTFIFILQDFYSAPYVGTVFWIVLSYYMGELADKSLKNRIEKIKGGNL